MFISEEDWATFVEGLNDFTNIGFDKADFTRSGVRIWRGTAQSIMGWDFVATSIKDESDASQEFRRILAALQEEWDKVRPHRNEVARR